MQTKSFKQTMSDGTEIWINRWAPDSDSEIKAVIQLHHGLAEHSMRYDRLGSVLAEKGFGSVSPNPMVGAVLINDKGVNIKSNPVTKKDISGFTKLQVVQNPLLKERVIGALGEKIGNIDLMDAITSTQQEIRAQISKIESGKVEIVETVDNLSTYMLITSE